MLDIPALAASDRPEHNLTPEENIVRELRGNVFLSAGPAEHRSLEDHNAPLKASTCLRVATDMCTLLQRKSTSFTARELEQSLARANTQITLAQICRTYALIFFNPEALLNVYNPETAADNEWLHPGVLAVIYQLAEKAISCQEERTGDHDQRLDDLPEKFAEFQAAIEHKKIVLPKISLFRTP